MKNLVIKGVECRLNENGVVELSLEHVARGLGFTTIAGSGNEVVRWNTVHSYLMEFGVAASCNDSSYRDNCPDYVAENIFYKLCFKAKNETAKSFQDLVTDEILPSIRKHGAYMTPQTLDNIISDPEFGIKLLTALKDEKDKRNAVEFQNEKLQLKIEKQAPAVLFAESVEGSVTNISIGDMAKLICQSGVNIGQNRLYDWLVEHKYLICRKRWSNKQKKYLNDYMPTQTAADLKVFHVKPTTISTSAGTYIKHSVKVTGKGQTYFINKFFSGHA